MYRKDNIFLIHIRFKLLQFINQMICWLMTSFFTSIRLLCSIVARYIASCPLCECLSVFLCFSWSHAFWIRIDKTYKQKFSSVCEETSLILDPTLQLATYWTDTENTFPISSKKRMRKIKIKIIDVVKYYALTRKRFLKTSVFY